MGAVEGNFVDKGGKPLKNLKKDQVKGQSRSRDCLNGRQVAMYLIRRMTSLSLEMGVEKENGCPQISTAEKGRQVFNCRCG